MMIIFFAIIYWRWQAGGPTRKLDLEKIQMVEKGETATKVFCIFVLYIRTYKHIHIYVCMYVCIK